MILRPLSPLCLSILLALASREGAAQARSRPIGVVKLGESTASVEATNVGYALITVSDGDQEQSVVVRADALAAWVDSARAIIALVPAVQPKGQVIFASPQLVSDRGGGALQLWSTVGGHNPGLAINVVTPAAIDLVVPLSAGSFGELAQVLDLAVSTTRQLSPRTFARAAPVATAPPTPVALPPTVAVTPPPHGEKVAISTGASTAATPPRDDTVAHDPLRLGTPTGESVSHVDRGALATGDANARTAAGVVTERRDADVLGGYARAHGAQLKFCYQEYGLKVNPDLAGTVTVAMMLDGSGAVTGVTIAQRSWSGPGVAEAEGCIRERMAAWHFPPSAQGPATARFRFSFTSGRR